MNLFHRSFLAVVLLTMGLFTFFSCDKQKDIDEVEADKGVYKVELTLSGDLENFQPMVMIFANYDLWEKDQFIFDATGAKIEHTGGYGFNYKDDPTPFSKPLVCSSTSQARGMATKILCGNPEVYSLSPSPKIKIDYKGYRNGKLIKSIQQEIDALTATTDGNSFSQLIGRDMMGLTQGD